MEAQKLTANEMEELDDQKPEKVSKPGKDGARKEKKEKKKKKKKKLAKKEDDGDDEIISEIQKSPGEENDSEEADFWIPPPGARWDFDDGGDRWGSESESENNDENKSDEVDGIGMDFDVNLGLIVHAFFVSNFVDVMSIRCQYLLKFMSSAEVFLIGQLF